ncbi:MAG: ABC transporter ATP-binding protein [Oscillibacter sp.]|nr:ABC transporter ATP-binding protein [Oscillibacter sp.]MDD3346464.1 ABC transporter ATP-binding protein [Oscillibacter sp.]
MIRADHVSMRFRLSADRITSMKEYLVRLVTGRLKFKEFGALSDVSFAVQKGEVLGIIGHNGAGKSTLLKVISGILKPSNGSVTVHGNIVPMLELGSGFDYDMTGRENIFLNGAILGYSKEFLTAKCQEIIDFSELGEFIEEPIRNYSSGMMMRLAFSIATVVEPEILIVDEILAVGDADFQAKSKARMLELMGGGTTVLMVSHTMSQIRELCDKVLWLEHGTVQGYGETAALCDKYEGKLNSSKGDGNGSTENE